MFSEHLHADGVLEIVIDRPPVNAFSIGLAHDLAQRLEALARALRSARLCCVAMGGDFAAAAMSKRWKRFPALRASLASRPALCA